jgi:dolichol kinase
MVSNKTNAKMQKQAEISYTNELLRKAIHLSSLSIPIMYGMLGKQIIFRLILISTILSVGLDVLSHKNLRFRQLYLTLFGRLLRAHETQDDRLLLNGASWVLIAAFLCILFLPQSIAITAFSILIVSDTAAALIGRKLGKHRFFDKSVEGTAAFIVSAIGVVLVVRFIMGLDISFVYAGILGSIIGGIVEAASIRLKMDDNLSIPLSVGLTMWLADWVAFLLGFSGFLDINSPLFEPFDLGL